MSARNKKTKPQGLPVLANAEFKPIDRVDTWSGTRHDEWAEASEALQQGAVFAAGICAMGPRRVRKAAWSMARFLPERDGASYQFRRRRKGSSGKGVSLTQLT